MLPEWQDSLKDDKPETWHFINGVRGAGHDDMAAFLCWLGVRLMECHRILRPTGSLYLHIDHTAHAYAKVLMDTIFGRKNFRNEIVWDYTKVANSKAKKFLRGHDSILFYAKSKDATWNRLFDDELSPRKQQLIAVGYNTKNMGGQRYLYIYDQAKVDRRIAEGKINMDDFDIVRDVDTSVGNAFTDVFKIPHLNSQSREKVGYPTQKPLALYERIIKASSNEGDMVLDPFCGCATTPVAAERLGRQWIGMDTWERTHQVVLERLHAEQRIFGEDAIQLVSDPDMLERTDGDDTAAEYLPPIYRPNRQSSIPRDEMMRILVNKWGLRCWGCGFEPPTIDFLELDHNTPASSGGSNELNNRTPLCGPCNRRKSDTKTLRGLRLDNKREGRWYGDDKIDKKVPIPYAFDWAKAELERRARQAEFVVSA